MDNYTNVLVALDLTDEASDVLSRAQQVAANHGAKLSVLTVIRPLTYAYTGLEFAGLAQSMVNFEAEAEQSARQALADLCKDRGIAEENTHIVFGMPAHEIKSQADELGVDLIVVGSHGRRGLGLLLGSTANGVLHGANQDVLTVRVQDD